LVSCVWCVVAFVEEGLSKRGVVRNAETVSIVPQPIFLSEWLEAFVSRILVEGVGVVALFDDIMVVVLGVCSHVKESVEVDLGFVVWSS
jgi:hypothetical protein